jgi:signal peptidase II
MSRGKKSFGSGNSLTPWLLLSAVVVLLDQITKIAVERRFSFAERLSVIQGFFDLTLVYNKGAAFSFLASAGGWQRWFFIGLGSVAAIFLIYLLVKHASQRLFCFGLAMILGGAIGNVIDRVWRGQVVDFLLVFYQGFYWPAFNIADSAITIGAACLIIDEIRRVRASRKT